MEYVEAGMLTKLCVLNYISHLDRTLAHWGVDRNEVVVKREPNCAVAHVFVTYDTKKRIDTQLAQAEQEALAEAFATRAHRGIHPTVRFSSDIQKLMEKYPEKASALDLAYRQALTNRLKRQLEEEATRIDHKITDIMQAKLGSGGLLRTFN